MSTGSDRPTPHPRGLMVELVRLILVAVFAAGAWRVAVQLGEDDTGRLVLAIVLGSGIGYVIGGVLGRRTVTAVTALERELGRVPASELLAGVLGIIAGLLIAVLASILLFRLPAAAAAPTVAFVAVVLGYVGFRIGRDKHEELFGLFGLKPRASGVRPGEVSVLDTSALIDGRILEVARSGFLGGTLLVPKEVLDELRQIADSSEAARRSRGRRGLEVLRSLQGLGAVDVSLVDEEIPGTDVDAKLLRLARDRGAVLVTTDTNLARVASTLDVPVRSIQDLASAIGPALLPGEAVTVELSKTGREHGQGVGFLEDGTMVVVEEAAGLVGSKVPVTVTNILQTASGRMLFARLAQVEDAEPGGPGGAS